MAYTLFNKDKPTGSDSPPTNADNTRKNLLAVRDAVVAGAFEGWDMSTSGGTAAEPDKILHTKGTEIVRLDLTWNASGNPSQIVYEYSSDSGSSYDTIGTESISYDANDNVTGTTWS